MSKSTYHGSLPASFTNTGSPGDSALVRQILLSQLHPNPYQPRHERYREGLDELVQSVRQYGILQPLLVRQLSPYLYEIIAGERRCYAARRAGLESVPCIVKAMTDQESAEVALIENLQREDLSPIEMARAFRALMKDFGLSQQEVSKKVGKSQSTVSNFLHLLQLPEKILDSLEQGEIQEGHARALLRIEDKALQEQLWQQVVANRLSVRKTEQLAHTGQTGRAEPVQTRAETISDSPAEPSGSGDERQSLAEMNEHTMQERLTRQFACRVSIRRDCGQGGHIEIGFYDQEALRRLVGRLLKVSA